MDKKLFQAEKRLLEQTVVASIRLESMQKSSRPQNLTVKELAPVQELATFGNRTLLQPSASVRGNRKTMSEFFRAIAMSMSEDIRPQDEQLAFFLSDDANDGYVVLVSRNRMTRQQIQSSSGFTFNRQILEFEVLAPSEEVAKARAETLVSLLQKSIADPVRQYVKAHQADLVANVESMEERLEEIRQQLSELKDKLSKAADIEAIELNRLKTQQQLLDVEIVGVRARIQAVEKLRQQYENDIAVGKKLDDIKMAAEIDLAGLAASKGALAEVIQHGEQSVHLEDESLRLHEEQDVLTRKLRDARSTLERFGPTVESAENLFMPYKGEVTIAPIRWVQLLPK